MPQGSQHCPFRVVLGLYAFPYSDIHNVEMKNLNTKKGGQDMNPKVMMIVKEFFPKIVDTHIRTRSSVETTMKSLERYHSMGLQAIRNLPAESHEENRKALDLAFQAAVQRLEEFHSRETSLGSCNLKTPSDESEPQG